MPKGMQTHRHNHMERQELLKKNKMAAGLVSERFPGVSQIVLRMSYYQRGARNVVMIRTLNFCPTDYAYFHIDCTRDECTNGGFDLTPIVDNLVRERKKSAKGRLICDGKGGTLAPNHTSIGYEISLESSKTVK